MTIANLETITDMQSWCRTWPPNGSKRIHKKPRQERGADGKAKRKVGVLSVDDKNSYL